MGDPVDVAVGARGVCGGLAGAFAVAGLFAEGETIVQDTDCIRESYPGFETVLEQFTNPKRMQISTPVIGSLSPARVEEA